MPIELLRISSKFEKQYKKLPPNVKEIAKEKELIFCVSPFDSRLNTHKLHDEDREL